jgi:hypothetical protein
LPVVPGRLRSGDGKALHGVGEQYSRHRRPRARDGGFLTLS